MFAAPRARLHAPARTIARDGVRRETRDDDDARVVRAKLSSAAAAAQKVSLSFRDEHDERDAEKDARRDRVAGDDVETKYALDSRQQRVVQKGGV